MGGLNSVTTLRILKLVMEDMFHEQVLRPRDAKCVIFANSHGATLMDNHSILIQQPMCMNNSNVYFHTAVQKRVELTVIFISDPAGSLSNQR